MPQKDPNDLLLVRNIDLNSKSVTTDIIKRPFTHKDPEGKETYTSYEEVETSWDHSLGFRFYYGGKPFTLKPGEKRVMPRYLADHFVKHLLDHMLNEEAQRTKNNSIFKNPAKRKELTDQIVEGVYQFANSEDDIDEGARIHDEYEKVNRRVEREEGELDIDASDFERPTDGVEKRVTLEDVMDTEMKVDVKPPVDMPPDDEEEEDEPEVKAKKPSLADPKNLPSREELLKAAEELSIELKGKESDEELVALIKQYA